jgi:environmental stress-induced protein Ves
MKVLRASDYKRMPWKNGGGETVEIAVFPPSASVNDFDWRISTATVAADGPFSIFSGIDRTLSILDGNGMALQIDGKAPILLTKERAPLAFAADIPVHATLPDGAITDLNVMTRRGRFDHDVNRLTGDFRVKKERETDTILLLATGTVSVEAGGKRFGLNALDALLVNDAAQVKAGNIACYVIRLTLL